MPPFPTYAKIEKAASAAKNQKGPPAGGVNHMRERNGTTWALAAALLAAAILSFALVTPWAASAETHAASLTALEEKQSTVLELAAASTAASLKPSTARLPLAYSKLTPSLP